MDNRFVAKLGEMGYNVIGILNAMIRAENMNHIIAAQAVELTKPDFAKIFTL